MKIAVVGYGNLGKAIAKRQKMDSNFELVGIFSRRKTESSFAPVYHADEIYNFKDKVDCLLLAGGSSKDLPNISPLLAKDFNIVDSFDIHAKIKAHYFKVNESAMWGNLAAIISCGWDPGLFSLFRHLSMAFLSEANISSFWGRGVSQGHSEAIRRIEGVRYAIEYTAPKEEAVKNAFLGINSDAKISHVRECYVVSESGLEMEIEEKIKNMPEYFLGYETIVNFISEEEFLKSHNLNFHGGRVISVGKTGSENDNVATMALSVEMSSNPEFTASIMLAYARAAKRLFDLKIFGAKTSLEVPPSFLFDGQLFNLL